MGFADTYGYKTNVANIVAFAEGDEYADGEDTKVDLVLVGHSSGGARRKGVVVAADEENAETNQAWPAVSDRYTAAT